jgi:hypothetical protein
MARYSTAEEVRASNIAAMGAELGELFTTLSTELTWLVWRWRQYVTLYGEKPTRITLLNQSAAFFFAVVQGTLWEETLLGISRLAGPEKSAGYQLLSTRRIPPLLPDLNVRAEADRLLERVLETSEFALDWRHRRIAHRNLDLALDHRVTPLTPASQEDVQKAIGALANFLNYVERHFLKNETDYRGEFLIEDAMNLLHVLRDGLACEERRRQRLEAGEYTEEDREHDERPPI